MPLNYNLTPVNQLVFTPNPNSGSINKALFQQPNPVGTVYLGGPSVTQSTGLPVGPGNAPFKLTNIGVSVYACGQVQIGALSGTLSTNYSAGTTTVVTNNSISTTVAAVGNYLVFGNTARTGWEVVSISTIGTGYTTFGTSALALDHFSTSSPVYAASAVATQLLVTPGVS